MKPVLLFLLASLASVSSSSAEPTMVLNYSWAGVVACSRSSPSPAFTLQNVPQRTVTLDLTLVSRSGKKLGSGSTRYNGQSIEAGAIQTPGPCSPSQYVWIVEARDASGVVLAVTDRTEHFPD